MEIIGPAPEALTNEEIIKRYDAVLTQLIRASLDSQYDFERQILVNQARLNWQFVRGNHFNVPGDVASPYGQIADYLPFDGAQGEQTNGPDIKLCPPVNVVGGDLYKFMAVMGQNAPRVKAVADDPDDAGEIECARNADVNIRDLWVKNHVDRMWKALAFHQYVTGPVFLRGCWNTDAKKYGQSIEPQIELQVSFDGSYVPNITGHVAYANGDAEMKIYSVLEVSVPYEAKELCGNPLRCEVMLSKWSLLPASTYSGEPEEFQSWQ